MLTIYHSNQIDLLKMLVAKVAQDSPLNGVFEKECILVQSPGMAQWLKQELADVYGICANFQFPLPSSFIWKMFTKILEDVPERSAFTKESMKWNISKLLPELLHEPEYKALKNYLGIGDITETKIHQLSQKIADTFDQYLVYRPEWILAWENGDVDHKLVKDQPWQPLLWKTLYDHTLSLGMSHYHRANLYGEFIDILDGFLERGKRLPRGIPKRIFVFGISSLPPRYLDALEALGKHIDIHFMFFNPCRFYWGDIKDRKYTNRMLLKQYQQKLSQSNGRTKIAYDDDSVFSCLKDDDIVIDETLELAVGNSLLASMGKLGRDNLSLMSERSTYDVDAFVDIERDTLLHCLQEDILNLEDKGDATIFEDSFHKEVISKDDHSISLHSCYSPMREIEALHNQLLHIFNSEPSITPRDVIVMVSDINQYAPYIDAVFGNIPFGDERYIPYSVSDKTADHEHAIVSSFLKLLDVNHTRFTSVEVMELLKTTAILNRFDISTSEFDELHNVIKEVGIRWGLNEDTSDKFDLPSLDANTWSFGIKRLLIGYSMSAESGFFGEVLPYDLPMGVSYESIGKLSAFVDMLSHWHNKLDGEHDYKTWFSLMNELIEDFFNARDSIDMSAISLIQKNIQKLHEVLTEVNYEIPLSLNVIGEELRSDLTKEQMSQKFLAGKVNFCTLMPMRSIPFKVVCLIGMNDGVYPRSVAPANYDLMNKQTQLGDRSRRLDDRYMFLEAILSAQDKLYISYVGHSSQDGSDKMPSILSQEILDYCSAGYCIEGDECTNADISGENLVKNITFEHAMNPYSTGEFFCEYPTFSKEWEQSVNSEVKPELFCPESLTKDKNEDSSSELNLAELLKFWKLPVKHFFNRRLKCSLNVESNALSEDEPFNFDALEAYKLRKDWLTELVESNCLDSDSGDEIFNKMLAQARGDGRSPIAGFGEVLIANERQALEDLSSKVIFLQEGEKQPIDINLNIKLPDGDVRLIGLIKDTYGGNVICSRVGKTNAKDILEAWIKQLALSASGIQKKVYILGVDAAFFFEPMPDLMAEELLKEFIEAYYVGLVSPLPYIPKVAHDGLKACKSRGGEWKLDGDTKEKALKRMQTSFDANFVNNAEYHEPHVTRVWPHWTEKFGKESFKLASCFMQPALASLRQYK